MLRMVFMLFKVYVYGSALHLESKQKNCNEINKKILRKFKMLMEANFFVVEE